MPFHPQENATLQPLITVGAIACTAFSALPLFKTDAMLYNQKEYPEGGTPL